MDGWIGSNLDLRSNAMRPLGWTSGDAAGLPILPGLVRYGEVAAGDIDHVIRFTVPKTANTYVWPASHKAGIGGASDPPMGAWFRLKANYDISRFSATNQVILRALKKHGMVVADNGSAFYMSGVPDPRWDNSDLNALKTVPGSAFEAVDVSSLKVSNTSYAVNGGSAPPPPPPPPAGLVSNPGFESNLTGWIRGNPSTTLVRTCSLAHGGSCSAELGRLGSPGETMLDDSPNSVAATAAGAAYAASAWVRAPSGRKVRLRIRELKGATTVRSRTASLIGDGSWRQLAVTSAATSGGTSLSVEILVSLTSTLKADIDDVTLIQR